MQDLSGTVIVGVGNPARGDDALGRFVARRLVSRTDAVVIESDGEPGALIGILNRAGRAFIVDAADFGAAAGTFLRLDATAAPLSVLEGSHSTHGLGIGVALELARALGQLPRHCILYAVQGESWEPGAALTPRANEAVGAVARAILHEIGGA